MSKFNEIEKDFAPLEVERVLEKLPSIGGLVQMQQQAKVTVDDVRDNAGNAYNVKYLGARVWLNMLHTLTQSDYLKGLTSQEREKVIRFATEALKPKDNPKAENGAPSWGKSVASVAYVESAPNYSTSQHHFVWQHWIDGEESALSKLAFQYAKTFIHSGASQSLGIASSRSSRLLPLLNIYERFANSKSISDPQLEELVHEPSLKENLKKYEFKKLMLKMLKANKLLSARALVELIPENPKMPDVKDQKQRMDVLKQIEMDQREAYSFWSFGIQSSNSEELELCALMHPKLVPYERLFKPIDRLQKDFGLRVLSSADPQIPVLLSKKGYVWDSVSYAYACASLSETQFKPFEASANTKKAFDSGWGWSKVDNKEVALALLDFLVQSNDSKKIQQARERVPQLEELIESSKKVKDKWGNSISPIFIAVAAGANELLKVYEPKLKGQKLRIPDTIRVQYINVHPDFEDYFQLQQPHEVGQEDIIVSHHGLQSFGSLSQGINVLDPRLKKLSDKGKVLDIDTLRHKAVEVKKVSMSLAQCALLSEDVETIGFVLRNFDPKGVKIAHAVEQMKDNMTESWRLQVEQVLAEHLRSEKSIKMKM